MTFNTTDFKFHNTGIAISDALFDRIMASFQLTRLTVRPVILCSRCCLIRKAAQNLVALQSQ